MLTIIVGDEGFNETTQTFELVNTVELTLEHSLVSLSKWESLYQRPFLSDGPKTSEEIYGYLKAMLVTPIGDPDILLRLSPENISEIQKYIDSKASATTFGRKQDRPGPSEIITSELIYYWMVAFNIPFECEHWHLNRLFALIRICNIKNSKPQKQNRHEAALQRSQINAQRRAHLNTSG